MVIITSHDNESHTGPECVTTLMDDVSRCAQNQRGFVLFTRTKQRLWVHDSEFSHLGSLLDGDNFAAIVYSYKPKSVFLRLCYRSHDSGPAVVEI